MKEAWWGHDWQWDPWDRCRERQHCLCLYLYLYLGLCQRPAGSDRAETGGLG